MFSKKNICYFYTYLFISSIAKCKPIASVLNLQKKQNKARVMIKKKLQLIIFIATRANVFHFAKKNICCGSSTFLDTCVSSESEKVEEIAQPRLVLLDRARHIVSFRSSAFARTDSLGQAFVTLCGSKNQFNNWERSRTTDRLSTPAW